MNDKIKRLICSCCGAETYGRQWHNRDTGYGLCDSCNTWLKGRDTSEEEMTRNYGVEFEHYNVSGGEA